MSTFSLSARSCNLSLDFWRKTCINESRVLIRSPLKPFHGSLLVASWLLQWRRNKSVSLTTFNFVKYVSDNREVVLWACRLLIATYSYVRSTRQAAVSSMSQFDFIEGHKRPFSLFTLCSLLTCHYIRKLTMIILDYTT